MTGAPGDPASAGAALLGWVAAVAPPVRARRLLWTPRSTLRTWGLGEPVLLYGVEWRVVGHILTPAGAALELEEVDSGR